MSCLGLSLATKGMICCPEIKIVTQIEKCVIPINVRFTKDVIPLNLKQKDPINLTSFIDKTKFNLKKLDILKLNKKLVNSIQINLKKCED